MHILRFIVRNQHCMLHDAETFQVKDILRTIDALAWNKFNIIHIHMTDSQSWPMDIPTLPELSQKGAYATGLSYTPSDITQIQTFAAERAIQIIIEIDMPGHSTAIGLSHPELIAALNAEPWSSYCAEPPCGSLQLNNPDVATFLESLFADVLPRLTEYSSYFHTGGDEVNMNTYLLDPTVKSNDKAVLQPLIQKFIDRNHNQVRTAGLTPIVWEEMLLDWNLTLGNDVIVQAWLSDASVASITSAGHKAIAGNYNYWVRALHLPPVPTNQPSTSIVAKANLSPSRTALPSNNTTHSMTTALLTKTGA